MLVPLATEKHEACVLILAYVCPAGVNARMLVPGNSYHSLELQYGYFKPMAATYVRQHYSLLLSLVYHICFNFRVFSDQQPSMKVSSCEHLDQPGNESAFVRRLHHKNAKMAAIH